MIHACSEDPLQCWNVHVGCVKCFISAYKFLEIVVIFASLIKGSGLWPGLSSNVSHGARNDNPSLQ